MKKVLLILLSTLLFISCERISIEKPIETETRVYELTDVDGKTKTYTFYNVDVNASEPKPPIKEVLNKYNITEEEYYNICNELKDELSVGSCGWCI